MNWFKRLFHGECKDSDLELVGKFTIQFRKSWNGFPMGEWQDVTAIKAQCKVCKRQYFICQGVQKPWTVEHESWFLKSRKD